MQFAYTAKNNKSQLERGVIEANDKGAVASMLRKNGLFPINIKVKSETNSFLRHKVGLKEKIIFTEQLEIMIRSGLSILEALKSLSEETENKTFAEEINQIVSDVEGGSPLSDALEKHPKTFNEIYINLIRSGERSGKVDVVLKRLSEQLKKDYELSRKIRGALAYPVFVLCALLVVIVIILLVIIPQLKLIFEDAGVELPATTRMVIYLSTILQKYGIYCLGVIIAFTVLIMRWHKTKEGRRFFDKLITKIPVIGNLLKKSYMARFTRTFSSLAASGLPLLDIFKVSGNVIGNVVYSEEVNKMSAKIKNGASISKTLKESPLFPSVIAQLTTVGEKSGNLDNVFDSLADFFERDVDSITANLSTLLEPFLIVTMGVGIGAIILSVLQPIYGLVNAI